MRTRLLTLLLPLLAILGFAPTASGVVPSTANISASHDTTIATAGQGFSSSLTVDATSVAYSHSVTVTPTPGFTITAVQLPPGGGQTAPSQSGSSWVLPVSLNDETATWGLTIAAAPTAGDAIPFQISNQGTANVGAVPQVTVSPVRVAFGPASRVLFPGAVGATASSSVQVLPAEGAPSILTSAVTVSAGVPTGITSGTVVTTSLGSTTLTAGPSAAPGANVIGGPGRS